MKSYAICTAQSSLAFVGFCGKDLCIAVDITGVVSLFELPNIAKRTSWKLPCKKLSMYGQYVSISSDGKLLACCIDSSVIVFYSHSGHIFASFTEHNGDVESVAFDETGEYLASGGSDGRVFVYDIKSQKKISAPISKPDFISSLAFQKGVLAVSSYDKSIDLLSLPYQESFSTLIGHDVSVLCVKWISQSKLLAFYQDGPMLVWDTIKLQISMNIKKLSGSLAAAVISQNGKYLYTCARGEHFICLYDLKSGELISPEYIRTPSAVCTLACFEEMLIVGTIDKSILLFDLNGDKKELETLLEGGLFADAYTLCDANPLLKQEESYEILEEAWSFTFSDAIKLLEHKEIKRAKELLQPFLGISTKRLQIQKLFKEFEDFEKFLLAIKLNHIEAARSMALKNHYFRKTSAYAALGLVDK